MGYKILLMGLCLWCVMGGIVLAQSYQTPLAGEAYKTTIWGIPIEIPPEDRRSVTAVDLGLYWIPHGPQQRELLPLGTVFLWRNLDEGQTRFRGLFSGLYNDVRYNITPSFLSGAEAVLTFENETLPFARSEYVEGVRIAAEELKWYQLRFGMGIGYRTLLKPDHQDNAVELALTYEPSLLLFDRGHETDPAFIVPSNTYEGRLHFRLRADALDRNLLELPHRGWAGGLDGWYGHRARWEDWGGGVAFGLQEGHSHKEWVAVSGYVVTAVGFPFVNDEHYRLIVSAYGGIGRDLDRFSAFRLGGGESGGEWEALAHPILPGAALEEFFPHAYGLFNLEYRYELLFFSYLHLRGTFGWVDRPRFLANGSAANQIDALPAITAATTSGFFWDSQVEIGYTRNFGILRKRDGNSGFGGDALLFSWSKEF